MPFDLAVVKAAETTPLDGDDMTWHFTVTNNGIGAVPGDVHGHRHAARRPRLPVGVRRRVVVLGAGPDRHLHRAGPLARGASSTFRIVTGVSLATGKEILNGAKVDAAGIELTKENNREPGRRGGGDAAAPAGAAGHDRAVGAADAGRRLLPRRRWTSCRPARARPRACRSPVPTPGSGCGWPSC